MPSVESVAATDEGLASELRLAVVRLRRRLVNERDPDNDLSLGQMAVLGCLYRGGDQTVGQLAQAEQVQPPSMTRTVTCLAISGFVVRRPHETDGRQVVVSLTETGRARVLADRERRTAWLLRCLTHLDPGDREILRAAAPILEKLSQEKPATS